ncbi:restriction endonuclease subunit S [Streptomyces sp. NPDC093261]|uniref:restriction endonuclease subunit S n=1 Tax=Streptomyces sp. NPDC093261 TaxID=3366037 RepID=UPI003822212C
MQLKNVPDSEHARRFLLADGDLLISRANTRDLVGMVGRYASDGVPCIYPDLMMRLFPDERRCSGAYLEIVLRSSTVRSEIHAGARGTSDSMVKISASFVEDIEIPLPTLEEQHRIAAAHAAFERRIGALKRVLAKLSISEQALSAKALEPRPYWKRATIESIADVAAGVTLGAEPVGEGTLELPYLRVANVLDGRIDTGDLKTVRIVSTQLERYALRRGDLLLTEGGDLDKLGRGAVWDGRIAPCLHQNHVFRVRCGSRMDPDFLALYTGSAEGRAYFQRVGKQTTNLASINSTQVKDMVVPVPPIEEQRRNLEPVRAVQSRSRALERQIAKLRTIQQAVVEDLLDARVAAGAA